MSQVRVSRAQRRGPDRRRALGVLLAVAVVLVAATAADILAAPAPPPPLRPVEQAAASAGTWYCPAVAGRGEETTVTIAAVGDTPAQVVVDQYERRRPVAGEPVTVEPGAQTTVALTGRQARMPVAVRWTGGPTAVTWRVDGERTAAAPCETGPSERWYATGFNTSLGSTSRLHLFNPFSADAVVRVVFATPEGPVRLVLTENVLVPAGGTTVMDLAEFQPEIVDLGVVVDVLAGRVVAQGELNVDPPKGTTGAAGRTMIQAAPGTSHTWGTPYAASGSGSEAWLSVLNPGEREAAIEVRVSAPSDAGTGLIGEVSVPSGGVTRIELAEVSANPEFGVSVSVVNDQPVVVSRMMSLQTRDGREALTGGLAASAFDTEWAVLGGGTEGRDGVISVYNPGPEATTVDIVAPGAPAEWTGIPLAPNGRAKVALSDTGTGQAAVPVRVVAGAPVVAELRSISEGERLRLWLGMGTPATAWIGPSTRPPVRFDSSLSTRAASPRPESSEAAPVPTPPVTSEAPAGTQPPAAPTDAPVEDSTGG